MGSISKRADKVVLEDRLIRPDQTTTPPISLIRQHDNMIEFQWWQSRFMPRVGLIVVMDAGDMGSVLVAIHVHRYDQMNVLVP